MDTTQEVLRVLDEVLSLHGRAQSFGPDTALLGAVQMPAAARSSSSVVSSRSRRSTSSTRPT